MATLIDVGGAPVNAVEREMVALLIKKLPDVTYVIPNVSIAQGKGRHPYEYDAIVVAPHAVYVVEIKGWYGDIQEVNRGEWRLSSGRYDKNPLLLNDQKAKVLASVLETLDLYDSHGNSLSRPYVHSCLLVGSNDTRFHISDDIDRCLTPADAADFFRDPARLPFSKKKAEQAVNRYKHVTKKIANHITGRIQARDLGARTFGNYLVTDTEQQGDNAAVFLAKHTQFDDGRVYRVRTWYLSTYLLTPSAREERAKTLRRSGEALHAAGTHPHVLRLVQFGEHEGSFYEVTEWSDTGTLSTYISLGKNQQMSVERKLRLISGICDGLSHSLEQGIIHRNLNPSAILVGADGEPKIGMFDRAFLLESTHTVYADTAQLGAREYLAPELSDADNADVFDNTDLYSVGVIAFELFTSYVPSMLNYSSTRMAEQLRQALASSEVADDVATFVFDCLSKSPDERPENPGEAKRRIDAMLATLAGETPATTPTPVPAQVDQGPPPEDPVATRQREGRFEPGERIDGSNIVRELLGTGAHSHVYRVENEIHGSEFALKIVDATCDDPDAPIREFGLLRNLGHPRLVHGTWAGRHILPVAPQPAYILLDLILGIPLDQWLQAERPSVETSLDWGLALLDALEAVHHGSSSTGPILHRDIKPANIMVTDSGPVMFDFSTACRADTAGDTPVGTLPYTPPDIADGGWDASCDTFAVGCVLYELLTGTPPWGKDSPSYTAPEPVAALAPEVPPPVAQVVARAIEPSRDLRFPTAAAFALALSDAATREPVRAQPTTYATASLEGARAELWGHHFVEQLLSADNILAPLYRVMRELVYPDAPDDIGDLESAFIAREARMMAIEEPLYETAPSVYDELVSYHAPQTLDGELLLKPAATDSFLLLEGLSPFDTAVLRQAIQSERTVSEFFWTAGPVDPKKRAELDTACRQFIPDLENPTTAANLEDLGRLVSHPLRWVLPCGSRSDAGLGTLLAQRHEQLANIVREVTALDGRTFLIATHGAVYLGHGLRHDVGAGMPNADRVRQTWAGAFGASRVGHGDAPLDANVAQPIRRAANRFYPIGRLAWPDSPDSPRVFSGGLSLSERLLPILVVEPKS